MHRLRYTRRPPSYGAVREVFLRLHVHAFERAVARWVAHVLPGDATDAETDEVPLRAVAIDRKTSRGSPRGGVPAVDLLAMLDQATGCVLSQARVPAETNEHKAALRLLEGLALEGRVVTGDAAFCQRRPQPARVEAGGHFLWKIDANQPTLLLHSRRPASRRFPPYAQRRAAAERDEATSIDKHCDRIERRLLTVTTMLEATSTGRTPPRSAAWSGRSPPGARRRSRPSASSPASRGRRPTRPRSWPGREATGESKTGCITSATSRWARTPTEPTPAPAPRPWRPCGTSPSPGSASKATNLAAALRRNATRVANLIDDLRRLKN